MGLVQKIFYYHMPSAWMFLIGGDRLRRGERPVPDHRRSAPRSDGAGGGGAGGAVRPAHARHRAAVGAQGLGHVVAVGRARHVEPGELDDRVGVSDSAPLRRPGIREAGRGLALFGMANVPFIYISVNYWRTIHPATTVVPTLPVSMGLPLWFCVVTFLLLFCAVAQAAGAARRAAGPAGCALPFTGRLTLMIDVETLVVLLVVASCACGVLPASTRRRRSSRREQQDEFIPIDQLPPQDQLPAAPLLVGAYAFVMVGALRVPGVGRAPADERAAGDRAARARRSSAGQRA